MATNDQTVTRKIIAHLEENLDQIVVTKVAEGRAIKGCFLVYENNKRAYAIRESRVELSTEQRKTSKEVL